MLSEHLQRVRDGANAVYSLSNLSGWIEKNTKLEGKNYSFKHHEYQKDIIDDSTKTLFVSKCAQSGLSEIFARWGMAACATQKNFTLIWTFPTTGDAERFCKARLDPFLNDSAEFGNSLSRRVNSTELKQFGANSFAYIRGTISETGALSVPADLLIHDEFDRSDMGNIAAYVSRLQHRPTKMRRIFSTPTVKKYGIDLASETSRRYKQMWKCSHCNEHFLPDYETNIIIPGWDKPKKEINKSNIKDIKWQQARLLCPHCGKEPSIDLEYREWILENPMDNYDSKTIFVAPFCLPAILTPQYLVKVSTEFDKWSEFVNQALGLTAEDEQDTLTETNVRAMLIPGDFDSSSVHFMGCDMGLMCHITIGKPDTSGRLIVVHREKVGFMSFEKRRAELCKIYKIVTNVNDMFPYTEVVQKITEYDMNSYGALYTEFNSTNSHRVKDQDENTEEGKINMRQVQINRNVALDELMQMIKAGNVIVKETEDKEEFVHHMRDMKRVQQYDKFGGIKYKWVKTQGQDHWHHSLLYCYIATKLRGTFEGVDQTATSLVTTVRVKHLTGRRTTARIW